MRKTAFSTLWALSLTLLAASNSFAAVRTSNGTGGGNWDSSATWLDGNVPAAADDVIIRSSDAVNVTAITNINSVTFSSNASSAVLSVDPGITLTVAAGITVQSATNANVSALVSGGGAITCASVTIGGTTTAQGNRTTSLTNTLSTLSISGNLSITGVDTGANDNDAAFALSSGSVSVGGSVVLTVPPGSAATLTLATGAQTGTLTLSGATPFSSASGTFTPNGTGATVIYSGAGQTVRLGTYQNLTLAGSGTKTTTGVTVNGTLSRRGTATLSVVPTYGASATVEYAGNALQIPGVEWPATVPNLAISNASGVSLAAGQTVNGTLTLSTGALSIGANTLTLNGAISVGSGTLTGGATSGITFGGSSGSTTLPSVTLQNLTVNRASGIAIGSGATVTGTLTLTNGIVTSAGNLTLGNGATIVRSGGSLDTAPNFGTTVNITYAGSSAASPGSELPAGTTVLNHLTNNNSGGFTLSGSLTVNGTLALNSGAVSIGANTLTLNGGISTTSGTLSGGASANIIFGGAGAATALPAVTLNDLTINRAAGINLGGNVTIGGTLTLTSGSFAVGANILRLNGPTIAGTPNNLTTTTSSSLVFGGSSSGIIIPASVAALNNLTNANTGSTITLSNNIAISGTCAINSGATLDGGGATLTLSGANTPFIVLGTFTPSTSTVNYTSINGANVTGGSVTYYNLSMGGNSSGDDFTPTGNLLIANVLTMGLGTFNGSGRIITLPASGTPLLVTGTIFSGTSTFIYTSTNGATVGAAPYNNLVINGTGTFSLGGNASASGTLQIQSGTFNGNTRTMSVTGLTTVTNGTSYLASTGAQTLSGGLTLAGGDFTCSSGTVTLGNVTLTSGTLTGSPTGTLNVAGNWASNGGTYSPNDGTITFTGSSAVISGITASQTFNNLTVAKTTGQTLSVGGSTTSLIIVSNFTETSGNFTLPASVTVGGNVILDNGTVTAGPTIAVSGNWTNIGGTFTPGSGSVTFDGTGSQSISGSASSQTFNNLIVNKPSGTLSVAPLTTTLTINGDLTLTAGPFAPGAATVNVAGNWINNSSFTPGSSTVSLNGTAAQHVSGSNTTTFNNLTIAGSNTKTLDLSVGVNGNLNISASTFDLGEFTANRSSAGGTFTIGTATLRIGGTNSLPQNYNTHSIAAASTIEYSGTNQSIAVPNSSETYGNLRTSGSGTKTLAGNITVSTVLTVGSGTTLEASNRTLTLEGQGSGFTPFVLNGTFTPSTSTVAYTGNSGPINVTGTNYYNLTLNNSGVTFTAAGNINVSNVLTVSSGTTFNPSSRTITLSGAGTPFVNSGTLAPATSTFAYTSGTGATVAGVPYNNLTINGTGSFALSASATVGGSLALTSGILATGGNQISVTNTSNSAIIGGSSSSYVNGTLHKTFAVGNGQSFTFPVGDASTYAPINVASMNVTTLGSLRARTFAGSHPNVSTNGLNPASDVNRYWTLTNSPAGIVVASNTVTFNYPATDVDSGASPATFAVRRWNNGWSTNAISGTPTLTATTARLGAAAFGDFDIGNQQVNSVLFTQQPTNALAGATMAAVKVLARDIFNAGIPSASVSLTLNSGTLNGTTTQLADSSGVATFGDLSINQPGSGKVLTATGGSHSTNSAAFSITNSPGSIVPTNTYNFTYADRAALLTDGWSFIATSPNGTPRNSEITDTNIGAVVSYAQTNGALGIVTRIPCDIGFLYSSATTIPDSVQDVPPMFLANQSRNSLFRSLPTNWVSIQLTMSFALQQNYQFASLMLYQDDDNYVDLGFRHNSDLANFLEIDGPTFVSLDREFYGFPNTVSATSLDASNVVLRLDRESGTDVIRAFYSLDGTNWTSVGQTTQVLTNTQFGIVIGASPNTFPLENLPVCDLSRAVIITSDTYSNPAPVMVAQPQHLVFNSVVGQANVATQRINIVLKNSANPANWTVSSNASWLSASITAGQTPAFCNVSVNTTGLLPGTHQGTLTFSASAASNSPVTTTVTLIVNPDNRARVSTWHDTRSGAMSVSVDDSNPTAFDRLITNGVYGTFAMWRSAAPAFYTDYYNAGMELASHTVNHACFAMHEPAFRFEIEGNIAGLVDTTPASPAEIISFAWPCGFATIDRQVIASDYFLVARGYNMNQLEDATPNDFMNVKSYNSHENTPLPPGDFKTIVDAAMAQGKWFNLVQHGVDNENDAIAYAVTTNIWVAPMGSVAKYILQRDRTIITNYSETSSLIQFDCYRLPLDSSSVRSFETAINPNDTLTMQVDVTDIPVVTGLTVNNVVTPYTNRVVNSRTLLCFNLPVGTNAQTIAISTSYQFSLTVTADNKARVYGAANPSLTGSLVGVQPGHNITATYTTIADATSPIGSYTIVPVLNDPAGQLTNYVVVTNVGALTISPAPLIVAADAKAKIYGNSDPALTYQVTNGALVNGDSFSGSLNRTAGENTGTYPINQGSLSAGTNYSLTFVPNDLTITSRGLTITADNKSKAYGAANPALTASYNGFASGEDTNALSALPVLNTTADTNSPAGSYPITASGAAATNYSISYVDGSLSVGKALLTVTADSASRSYGSTNPLFSASFSGFVNLDDASVLSGSPELASLADTNSSVAGSPYMISVTNGSLAALNYDFAFVDGLLSVTQAVLTVTADNQGKLYGAALPLFTASYSGFVNGEDTNVLSGSPDLSTLATANSSVAGSPYIISAAIGSLSASNYAFAFVDGSLNIATALLSPVIAVDNKIYDTTITATITNRSLSGILGIDDVSLVGGSATFFDKNVGIAKTVIATGLSLSGADAPNYILSSTSATNTADITVASLTASITASNKVYDTTTAAVIASRSVTTVLGLDDVSLIGGSATFADANAGSGKIVTATGLTLSGADAANYLLVSNSAATQADIFQAALTITADNKSKAYGAANPALTASYNGFASGEDTNALSALPVLNTSADTNSPAGSYPITASGAAATNYSISYVDGSLSVGKALLTVTADSASRSYGSTNSLFSASFSGFVNLDDASVLSGSPELASLADTNSSVAGSPYTISVTNGSLAALNYDFAFVDGLLSVTQAVLTVTADNQGKIYGAALPLFTASYSGFVNGEDTNVLSGSPDLSTLATANSSVAGSPYIISAAIGSLSASNYAFAFVDGSLNIATALLSPVIAVDNKIYDTTITATITNRSLSGILGIDDVSLVGGSATFFDKNVGIAKTVIATGLSLSGADAPNYILSSTSATNTADITVASLTASITASNKVYDTTTTAVIASRSVTTVLGLDDVSLIGGSATFADANAGSGKIVTATGLTLSGADAANYLLVPNLAATQADIFQAALIITADNKSKAYGAANPALTASYNGFASGEDTNALSALPVLNTSADTNSPAGSYPITASGAAAANYSISYVDGSLSVGKALLTVTANNASRSYGSTNSLFSASFSGFVNLDDASVLSGSPELASLADTNSSVAGSPYTISVTNGSLAALNYDFAFVDGLLSVTQAVLTVTADNQGKLYGAALPLFTASYSGFVNGEDTNVLSGSPDLSTLATANSSVAGSPYIISAAIGSLSASNYAFVFVDGSLNIATALLSPAIAVDNKIYDTTITATITNRSLSGILGIDDVSLVGGSASFSDKNVGIAKTVIATGLSLSGADALNYILSSTSATNTADITARSLTVTATGQDKVYDGTATATVSLSDDRIIPDSFTAAYTSAAFADKHVGTGKSISVSGINLSGDDALNYSANTSTSASANITTRPLTVSAVTNSKVYDSTTNSAATPAITLGSIAVGDSAAFIQNFDTKNVGTNKTLTASGSVLDGNSGNNYSVAFNPNFTGVITKFAVSGQVTVTNKVYDGTTAATIISRSLNFSYGGDNVSLSGGTANFNNANAGTSKTVLVTGLSLSGTDATNYALSFGSAFAFADITKAPLTVTADNKTRLAGLANPTLTATYTGFVAGQNTNVLTALATLSTTANASSPAGLYPITASGATAANYSFTYVNGTLTVVAQPALEHTRISGSDFTFTLQTLSGHRYQVEYTAALNGPWVALGDPIIGNGAPIDITTAVSNPNGFFRVKITLE